MIDLNYRIENKLFVPNPWLAKAPYDALIPPFRELTMRMSWVLDDELKEINNYGH